MWSSVPAQWLWKVGYIFYLLGYCSRFTKCGVAFMNVVREDFGKVLRSSLVDLIIDFSIKFLFGIFPAV